MFVIKNTYNENHVKLLLNKYEFVRYNDYAIELR